mmetsp:Transcript_61705/g.201359  ORF Transcript_61705/g.201359 Transcript_61705/m.201359 type:complete len:176 (+) Transcript_61705:76-603(+)
MPDRQHPNILVTGTPGVGKTTFCEAVAEATTRVRHLEVSKLVKEKKLYKEWDDEMACSIFDEDMLCDELENCMEEGGCVIDFHSSGFLPEHWFDLIVVLRAETAVLYDRLERRHYPEAKIKQNVEAEIFQMCLDEAREAFGESDVQIWEVQHDSQEQLEEAVQRVRQFAENFKPA